MSRRKLNEIGVKLDVSDKEIRKIKRNYLLIKIITPIIGAATAVLFTVLGHRSGRHMGKISSPRLVNGETGKEYPYSAITLLAIPGLYFATAPGIRTKRNIFIGVTVVITMIASIVGFNIAYDIAHSCYAPVEYYYGAIAYNAYSKETGKQ